ncbi:hypothetical protein Lser_V15G37985 [Lactuca serriola]
MQINETSQIHTISSWDEQGLQNWTRSIPSSFKRSGFLE